MESREIITCAGDERFAVLDRMRFVQNNPLPVDFPKRWPLMSMKLTANRVVRGNHEVITGQSKRVVRNQCVSKAS